MQIKLYYNQKRLIHIFHANKPLKWNEFRDLFAFDNIANSQQNGNLSDIKKILSHKIIKLSTVNIYFNDNNSN